MDNLAFKLNPISKLKIYRAVRDIIVRKMNSNDIDPERAMGIIKYTKENIVKVKSAKMAMGFCGHLGEKFIELKKLSNVFEQQSMEKYDRVVTLVIDKFMEENDIDLVDVLLGKMEKGTSMEQKEKLMAELKEKYPNEFASAIKKLTS